MTIEPLFNADDNEWVVMVGRYVLNMGAVEATTRQLISLHEQTDRAPDMNADLPSRLGFLKKHFPRGNPERHSWAMSIFIVANKHVGFRNIVAHSPLMITGHDDGSRHIRGILNLTPNHPDNVGQLVDLDEMRGRVDESAQLARLLLEMQDDFKAKGVGLPVNS